MATWVLGCGSPALGPVTPLHDRPVGPGEPRAELRLRVDLLPAQDCEQAFDLALYQNLAVDLVQWDGATDICTGRVVIIRYLSNKIGKDQLYEEVSGLAVKAEPVAGSER